MSSIKLSGIKLGVALGVLGGLPLAAQAEGFWQTRASFSPGYYTGENSGTLPDGRTFTTDSTGFILAADIGGSVGFAVNEGSTLIVDLELEAMTVDGDTDVTASDGETASGDLEFERTDLKATVGWAFAAGINVIPFIGTRLAWQGDGYFDDSFYSESGYVLGIGLSGISVGTSGNLAVSLAYNDTTLEAGGRDVDASGFSTKIGLRLGKSPVGYSLKYQTFDVDGSGLKEDYLLASVTWYFAQGTL